MKTDNPKYNSNSGFKVPENYFRNFEDRLMDKINDQDPAQLPVKESGFTVPQGYFNELEDRLLKETGKPTKVVKLFKKEYLFYAAAVAAIFVLMLGNFFKTEPQQNLGWDDVEITDMENYFEEDYNMSYMEWNTSEYSDLISDGSKIIHEEDFNTVDSEAVFDYLDENIEDPTYILE